MAPGGVEQFATPESFAEAFDVSRETLAKLTTYAALLARWQNTINLVAPATLGDVWHRHFADSAQLWAVGQKRLVERPGAPLHWLDVGSGAGFPGLVLAILGGETGRTRHTLIESDSRKAAFLREVARQVRVAVDILCVRIETPETLAKVGTVDCVTARALAPLPKLLPLLAPYFASTTTGLFLKGREIAAEIEESARDWTFKSELVPSRTGTGGSVFVIKALKHRV